MQFRLTDEMAHDVEQLAHELCSPDAYVDDPAWVERARHVATRLPPELTAALLDFRHDPGPDAALLIQNLPVHPDLGPTPRVDESRQEKAVPPAAVLAMVGETLGDLGAYRPEKCGALVQDVVPVPGKQAEQGNMGAVLLKMHTENAFHPQRPDYVALQCVRSDPKKEAALTVASIRKALPQLSEETVKQLGEPDYVTAAPPSFGLADEGDLEHAILSGSAEDPDVCVDFWSTKPTGSDAERAMAELAAAFDEVKLALYLEEGELAIVDNRLAVHGRTAFHPAFDGHDRWLQRAFIMLNHRASRGYREGGGLVLD